MPNLSKAGALLNILRKELLLESDNQFGITTYFLRKKIIDRRRFIDTAAKASASLITGGALLSSCTSCHNPEQYSTVAILGAGMAGLHAGLHFKEKNIDFSLFEAGQQAGGRIMTLYDALGNGLVTELGGEYIDSNHTDILHLVEKFKLSLVDIESTIKGESLIKDSYFFDGRYIDENMVIAEFSRYARSFLKDIRELDLANSDSIRKFDCISISDYLRGKEVSGWLLILLEAAFTAEYGLDARFQSALNFLTMVDAVPGETLRLYGTSDERYKIEGGNHLLIKRMSEVIADRIHYNHFCTRIQYQDKQFEIIFSSGKKHYAKYLLLTIPFTALRKIDIALPLPKEKRSVINGLQYGTNSKIIFGVDGAIWKKMGRSGYLFSTMIQNGWDSSIATHPHSNASYTVFQGGEFGSILSISKSDEYLSELEKTFQGFAAVHNQKKVVFNWRTSSLTEGSYAVYRVGDWSAFAGTEFSPVGNLHFAGEHCSTDFRGYMNGAAETGRLAAEAIISDIKK
jgi:monoamine oxidase